MLRGLLRREGRCNSEMRDFRVLERKGRIHGEGRTAVTKVDLKKELKHLSVPSAKDVSEVEVPPMKFLMIDGKGDPNTSQEYAEALEALYAVSYAIKFAVKRTEGVDYAVMPLEGLWWTDEMREFSVEDKGSWKWTAMIMQPERYVSKGLFEELRSDVERKKGLPAVARMRFAGFREGLSAQVMHLGPFSEEGPTIERIHCHIEERGGLRRGKHHEIYLSDFRRTKPERLKTVIRQPFVERR